MTRAWTIVEKASDWLMFRHLACDLLKRRGGLTRLWGYTHSPPTPMATTTELILPYSWFMFVMGNRAPYRLAYVRAPWLQPYRAWESAPALHSALWSHCEELCNISRTSMCNISRNFFPQSSVYNLLSIGKCQNITTAMLFSPIPVIPALCVVFFIYYVLSNQQMCHLLCFKLEFLTRRTCTRIPMCLNLLFVYAHMANKTPSNTLSQPFLILLRYCGIISCLRPRTEEHVWSRHKLKHAVNLLLIPLSINTIKFPAV